MLKYVAGMLRSDVRLLEGFLKKINAYVSLSHQELNMDLIKHVIREILPEGQADLPPEKLPEKESSQTSGPPSKKPPEKSQAEKPDVKQLEDFINEANVKNGTEPNVSIPEAVKSSQASDSAQTTPMSPKTNAPKKPSGNKTTRPLEVVLPSTPKTPADDKSPPPKEPIAPSKEDKKKEPEPEKTEDTTEVPIPELDEDIDEAEGTPAGHKEIGAVFFYPIGEENSLKTVYQKFQEVIKKHKLKFRLKRVHSEPYETKGKINYSSFVDVCKKSKVPVAIVIGPPPTSVIPEQDFYDLLSVTLDVQGVSLQLVNWAEISKDYRYLNLALDIALVRSR